ncbi:hypothetical protein SDC9_105716 [bioreactor metagenome]|uniref:Uncharacterized protein n=1 Tax=bioreactor metagenome TaxID=1076179 RepID=A0A645B6V9_9ZZZZ
MRAEAVQCAVKYLRQNRRKIFRGILCIEISGVEPQGVFSEFIERLAVVFRHRLSDHALRIRPKPNGISVFFF